MNGTITFLLFDKKCKKKLFYLCKQEQNRKQKYKKDLMKVFIANTGPCAPREYYLLFCRTCQSGFEWLKALLKQVLGSKPTVFTLI